MLLAWRWRNFLDVERERARAVEVSRLIPARSGSARVKLVRVELMGRE